MNTGSRRDINDLPMRAKALICFAAAIIHVILFFVLFPVFGRTSGSFGIVPVALVAGLFGTIPGMLSAVAILLLNIGLAALNNAFSIHDLIYETNWPGFVALFAMSLIIGELRKLSL